MENKEIKIVRLKSGEDVIASFTEDKKEKKVTLENPMHIIFKRTPSQKAGPMMYMLPWLPVEMVQDDIALIDSINVLTIFEPKGEMKEYYENIVIDAKQRMEEIGEDKIFEDESDLDEDEISEIRQALKEKRTLKQVH